MVGSQPLVLPEWNLKRVFIHWRAGRKGSEGRQATQMRRRRVCKVPLAHAAHPCALEPARFQTGLTCVQARVLSRRSQHHSARSGLPPWSSSHCGNGQDAPPKDGEIQEPLITQSSLRVNLGSYPLHDPSRCYYGLLKAKYIHLYILGEGMAMALQYSCLKNSPWTEKPGGLVQGAAKSQTRLRD